MNALYETVVDSELLSIRIEKALSSVQSASVNLAVQLSLEMALAELNADPLFLMSDQQALSLAIEHFRVAATENGWSEESCAGDSGVNFLGTIQRSYAAEEHSEQEPRRIGFCCGIELALDEGPEFGAVSFIIHRRVIGGRLEHVAFLLQNVSTNEQQKLQQTIEQQRRR